MAGMISRAINVAARNPNAKIITVSTTRDTNSRLRLGFSPSTLRRAAHTRKALRMLFVAHPRGLSSRSCCGLKRLGGVVGGIDDDQADTRKGFQVGSGVNFR